MRHDPLGFLSLLRRPVPLGLVLYPPDRDAKHTRRVLWDGGRLPGHVGLNVAYVVGWADTVPTPARPHTRDGDIVWVPGLWCESDSVQRAPFGITAPTAVVYTGGRSVHCYWLFQSGPLPVGVWRGLSARLVATIAKRDPQYLGDATVQRPAACMRLPGTVHPATGVTCGWLQVGPVYPSAEDLGLDPATPPAPVSLVRRDPSAPPAAPVGAGSAGWLSRVTDDVLGAMLSAIGPLGPVGSGTYTSDRWAALVSGAVAVGPERIEVVATGLGWDPMRVRLILTERQGRVGVGAGMLPNIARRYGWRWGQ